MTQLLEASWRRSNSASLRRQNSTLLVQLYYDMKDPVTQLYRTKTALVCVLLVVGGIGLMVFEGFLSGRASLHWLSALPWHELGGILVGAGLLSVWLDHFLRREQQAVEDQRLRALLKEQAPAMRDAVLDAFAANHEDLRRVATPQMLDQVITNSLALRLKDEQFAEEVYTDIRNQAVRAAERWYDAHLSIELSPLPAGRGTPGRSTSVRPSQLFTVTVRWEYTTVPRHAQRRFVCVSDRDEYSELAHEGGATSAWYLKPRSSIDASDPRAFELLRFAVNGEERPIRRASRKGSQQYAVSIGAEQVAASEPVTVAYTYQTITSADGHVLFFDIEQPTRDLSVTFDYTNTDIDAVSTLDLIPSTRPTLIERSPEASPTRTIRVGIDGWVFPRSGVAFVWTRTRDGEGGASG